MIVWLLLALLLLGALGAYWWWQRTPLTPGSFTRRTPVPAMMRLRRSTVFVALALILALCLGTVYLVKTWWPKRGRAQQAQEQARKRPPPPGPPGFLQRFPKEYGAEVPKETPPQPPPQPAPSGTAAAATPDVSPAPGDRPKSALPPRQPRVVPEPPTRPTTVTLPDEEAARGQPGRPAAAPAPTQEKPDAWRWFSVPRKPKDNVLRPPLADEDGEFQTVAATPPEPGAGGPGSGAPPRGTRPRGGRQSRLFPQAVWETPADRYKILYADQLVPCQLTTNINSDFPGLVLCKVTQAVEDRWGHGHVIIPLDTVLIGVQQGQPEFGQQRLPVGIGMAIFPDGTAATWEKGQLGDAMGAASVPMDVDNHYAKLFAGVLISAVLQVGVRAPFGSTTSFNPSLPQEFAQQAASGINQAAQRILQQFIVRPTLTQEQGFPVTAQFGQNLSFQTKAVVVRK